MELQRYDIDESKGYPAPVIVPDKLGDYYRADEVDSVIAGIEASYKPVVEERAALTAELDRAIEGVSLRTVNEALVEENKSLENSVKCLTAERDKLRDALEKIEGMATIETVEIQKIAQAALKQAEGGEEGK